MSDIKKEAKKLFDKVMSGYSGQPKKSFMGLVDDSLEGYNEKVKGLIENEISSMLSGSLSGDIKPYMIDNLSLSNKLYKNAKNVSKATQSVLNEHLVRGSSIGTIRKAIFDGYDYDSRDILPLKKSLPKYLTSGNKIEAMKLKTKPLKASYIQLLNSKNDAQFHKNMKAALYEKSRYYASRIAETEKARSNNLASAKDLLEDENTELVRFYLTGRHKITDICDYYASLDVGYGKGVVPKEQMITLPLHPHCMCSYKRVSSTRKKSYKAIDNPEKSTIEGFSEYEQIGILGSREKLFKWRGGESAISIFNSLRPKYPVRDVRVVLGGIVPLVSTVPTISFGYGGKFDAYVADIRDEAKMVIDKLPKPQKIEYKKVKRSHYKEYFNKIVMNKDDQSIFMHEYGHHIDTMLSGTKVLNDYNKTVVKANYSEVRSSFIANAKLDANLIKLSTKNMVEYKEKYSKSSFSDIFDSIYGGILYDSYKWFGHGRKYYKHAGAKEAENFANMFMIWSNKVEWKEAKILFPNLTGEFEEIMKGVVDGTIR